MDAVIAAKNLNKMFGNLTAVADVSFSVAAGECFGLLGPNGAGKTTTIRMLYGFSPLTSGTLELFGKSIAENLCDIKFRIGICQQDNSLDPDLTVLENLMVFSRYFDLPRQTAADRALKLLAFFGLEHRAAAKTSELSGGMQRRLVVARSLINQPDLLILDEPTTGLDPQSRQQVWTRLEELKRSGLTILLTTHYMDEAARLCDRLVIMDHGKVLVEGKPADLVRRHVGREVLEITRPDQSVRDFLAQRGHEFEDLGHRLLVYDQSCNGLFADLAEQFRDADCLLRMGTLEDVFLRLTGRALRE
ncbi:MAG: ATP-binding cassette domain-containing protein [Deltaproteobacteria bacterium]|nr:ATP-binding cassette domain-containing protein [Deltaproteobacteria bacterium]